MSDDSERPTPNKKVKIETKNIAEKMMDKKNSCFAKAHLFISSMLKFQVVRNQVETMKALLTPPCHRCGLQQKLRQKPRAGYLHGP